MDQYLETRINEIERSINNVSETLRYALIDEQYHADGNTSLKRRLQWIQDATAPQTGLLVGILVTSWIIAVTVLVATVHHW